jgi:hypothetical protein
MTEAVIELNPAFRGLVAKLRDLRPLVAATVAHLGFNISMMESDRDGALRFVIMFYPVAAGARENDVRVTFTAFGHDETSIKVRGPDEGVNLGLYKLAHLQGVFLRRVVDAAVEKAVGHVRVLAATQGRRQHWQRARA